MAHPLTDSILALTRYANETTGQSDQTLSEAVETLVEGYGQGGGGSVSQDAEGYIVLPATSGGTGEFQYLITDYVNPTSGASNQTFEVSDIDLSRGDYIEWSLSNVLTDSVSNDSVLRVGSNNGGSGLWTFANGQKYLVYTNKNVGISQIVCVVNGNANGGTNNYNVNNTPAGADDIVIRMDKDGLIINNVRWTTSNAQYATLKEWMLAQTTLYVGLHASSKVYYNYIRVYRAR